MNTQVNQEYIDIFPISVKRNSKPYARALSEHNLISIIRAISLKESFVRTEIFDSSKDFEFVIYGYYVKLSPEALKTLTATNSSAIYASIFLNTLNEEYPEIWGEDYNNVFTGVIFSDNPDSIEPPALLGTQYIRKDLLLLQISGGTYYIPESVQLLTDNTLSAKLLELDGGEV